MDRNVGDDDGREACRIRVTRRVWLDLGGDIPFAWPIANTSLNGWNRTLVIGRCGIGWVKYRGGGALFEDETKGVVMAGGW